MCDDSPPPSVSIDMELLIEEIHKRPMLWDRFSVEYNDRITKTKLWDEVHEAVFDDWSDLGSADKRIRGEEIKRKWRNLRDTHAKDLIIQKKARKGKMKKKKPYRYSNALSFLNKQFTDRVNRNSSPESSEDDEKPRKQSKKGTTDYRVSNLIVDVEALIREVKSRPLLWNKQSQMSERTMELGLRDKLWMQVCEILFENWHELGISAKALRTVEVKKKWRNLRDTYGKELSNQRKVELGMVKPKRPYRYFEELSFLLGSLEKRSTDEYCQDNEVEVEMASSSYSLESEYEQDDQQSTIGAVPKQEVVEKTYDEDVCFAEMLIPMLKKLNDDQKHYAQVKILNVLRRARQFDPLGTIERSTAGGVAIVKNEDLDS